MLPGACIDYVPWSRTYVRVKAATRQGPRWHHNFWNLEAADIGVNEAADRSMGKQRPFATDIIE